jgi:hypothetical protein
VLWRMCIKGLSGNSVVLGIYWASGASRLNDTCSNWRRDCPCLRGPCLRGPCLRAFVDNRDPDAPHIRKCRQLVILIDHESCEVGKPQIWCCSQGITDCCGAEFLPEGESVGAFNDTTTTNPSPASRAAICRPFASFPVWIKTALDRDSSLPVRARHGRPGSSPGSTAAYTQAGFRG